MKKLLAILASFTLLGLVVATPAHADYPPASGQVTVSTQAAAPGEAVTVTFHPNSFTPHELVAHTADGTTEIVVTLSSTVAQKSAVSYDYSKSLGSRPADAQGGVALNVAFKNAGKYTVTGVGATSGNTLTSPVITVAGSGSGEDNPSGPTHPQTGGISAVPLVAGIALLALGGLAILVSRRRNTH